MEIAEARAPTRIDLAGGTVDLWPLYLLHEHPLTVNAAIDLYADARVERIETPVIEVISKDRGSRLSAESPGHLLETAGAGGGDLEFLVRLSAHFLGQVWGENGGMEKGCRITTECRAPAGSGLGGSSTLGIALASALDRFIGRDTEGERILGITRGIETRVLRIPTGEQDYHPALRGGVLALRYGVEGTSVERLPLDLEGLRKHTVLVYTGQSRSSGVSNWDVMKRHLDGERDVRESLDGVILAAHSMREALLDSDWEAAGSALGREWVARKRLSPAVTNAGIDQMIDEGCDAGAVAGKVCGAGGGGCLVMWTAEDRRREVEKRLQGLGATILDFGYVAEGVAVTVS